jgi:hypothetical protein
VRSTIVAARAAASRSRAASASRSRSLTCRGVPRAQPGRSAMSSSHRRSRCAVQV